MMSPNYYEFPAMFYLLRCGINQRAGGEIGVAAVLVSVFPRGKDYAPVLRVTDGYTIAAAVLTRTNTIGRTRALCRSNAGNCILDGDAAA